MIRHSTHSRVRAVDGFTLIELLVVIAIIGAMVALLLPAVQAARETARRTQCASQIRQLALAALNYEGVHDRLPPSGLAKLKNDPPAVVDDIIYNPYAGTQFSWVVILLPHLEQASLAQRFDATRQIFYQLGNPQGTRLPSLNCPSDGWQTNSLAHTGLTLGKEFAKANYAAYVSPFHIDLQLMYRGTPRRRRSIARFNRRWRQQHDCFCRDSHARPPGRLARRFGAAVAGGDVALV